MGVSGIVVRAMDHCAMEVVSRRSRPGSQAGEGVWESVGVTSEDTLDAAVKDTADVINGREVTKEGAQVGELSVVRVVEPCRHRDCVVGVEDV